MITLKQAKQLRRGDILYDCCYANADGTPQRWRVNGKVKTWKTRPGEVQIPVKRGLYEYGYVREYDLGEFSLDESTAQALLGGQG